MTSVQDAFRAQLLGLGFDVVRFVRLDAPLSKSNERLHAWIASGAHADMEWIPKSEEKRRDPQQVLPGAKSAVLLGVNYWDPAPNGGAAKWARYSLYEDYHDAIRAALQQAARLMEQTFHLGSAEHRYYVDTGPVLERAWAERGGMGFIGKNGMLISRTYGNWLFLAEILTTFEFEADLPARPEIKPEVDERVGLYCGTCTRCMSACPTGAITSPGFVDARLCVSYQTIENRGIIPRELRGGIGDRVYGCDTCLEVCPWNRFAQEGRRVLLSARRHIAELTLRELLEMDAPKFAEVFRHTAIKRTKLSGLQRNACIVAANTGAVECSDAILRLAREGKPMVRAHAVWAMFRLHGASPAEILRDARARETDPVVIAEYEAEEAGTAVRKSLA